MLEHNAASALGKLMTVRRLKRREFITVLGGLIACPVLVRAQNSNDRVARVAYLGASGPSAIDPRQIEQFKRGLAENGLVEGRNITVDYLWAEGSLDRLRQLAGELAGRNLDVIVTAGSQAVDALIAADVKTSIVFAVYGDPIGNRTVDSLAHPGRNLTGLSMANAHLESKRLELLKEAFPALKRVAILHDSTSSSSLDDARTGARALGLEPLIFEAADPARFDAVFAEAANHGADGLAVLASAILNFHRQRLIALAARYRLPSIWESSGYVRDSGMLSYGPNFPDMYRRAAGYVARILGGKKPGDLPIEQPVKFELAVNLKTAKALDLVVPATLLTRADEVIE
jgi:putative tryptophan/tyrosine transport system substrate-binding protein